MEWRRAQLSTLGNTKVIRLSCWASVRKLNRQQRKKIYSGEGVFMAGPQEATIQQRIGVSLIYPPGHLELQEMSSKPSGVMEVTASEDEERMPPLDGIWETRGLPGICAGHWSFPGIRRIPKGPKSGQRD